eukprot:2422191-Pyramimonas_sp.AAC.1
MGWLSFGTHRGCARLRQRRSPRRRHRPGWREQRSRERPGAGRPKTRDRRSCGFPQSRQGPEG